MSIPKCNMFAYDCHAYHNGHCKCLKDTNFGSKPCPFYKTEDQNDYECELIAHGWPVSYSAAYHAIKG